MIKQDIFHEEIVVLNEAKDNLKNHGLTAPTLKMVLRELYETLNEYHRDLNKELKIGELSWEKHQELQVSARAAQRVERAFIKMFKDFRKNGIRTGLVENET
tara:strand:- start:835 stop:1140 length:306 start_codon:yes stop_codon:yes gene_type:complete